MSKEIIRNIYIRGYRVFITSKSDCNSTSPFQRYVHEGYSSILKKDGYEALFTAIGADLWNHSFLLQKDSRITEHYMVANSLLSHNKNLRGFLDSESAGKWIGSYVLHRLDKEKYPHFPKLAPLDAMRKDLICVLETCKRNPMAFHYASEEIQNDQKAAMAYVLLCADKPGFRFPEAFRGDRGLALEALKRNGVIYQSLSAALRTDPELTRLAFDAFLPRIMHETLPNYIPGALLNNRCFMQELYGLCPDLKVEHAEILLRDKLFVLPWVKTGTDVLHHLDRVPQNLLCDSEIKNALLSRFGTEDLLPKLQAKYLAHSLIPPGEYRLPTIKAQSNAEQQAFSLSDGEYYLAIQVSDEGYDYTIYQSDYTTHDGGQLDEADFSMEEAIEAILNEYDLGACRREPCDYYALCEITELVDLALLKQARAKKQSLSSQILNAEADSKIQNRDYERNNVLHSPPEKR